MFIRSERLFLRPGWPEDWAELLALIADEAVVRNLANVPWPYTAEDARDFIALPQTRLFPRFLITIPSADGARLIGGCGLTQIDDAPNLGYWIAHEYWGRGYATEAARAVLKLAQALGHSRIVAHHFVDNAASGRVLQKVGFHPTGRIVDRLRKTSNSASPACEYEAVLSAPQDHNGDDDMVHCSAA